MSVQPGQRPKRVVAIVVRCAPLFTSLGFLLTLTGCPLKDDYFVERAQGGSGAGGDGSSTGGTALGGATTGGSAASAGKGLCDAANCASSCCGDECVDIMSDALHCGACDVSCGTGRSCAAGVCASGWMPMAKPPETFAARQLAAFTSFAGKLFVFGGRDANDNVLGSAALYDLASDSWSVLPADPAAPSPRELATAVWTGSKVLVFGGRSASGTDYYQSGALYDPASGTWAPISDSIIPRAACTGGAMASEVVLWGGLTTGAGAASGTSRYSLSTDSWRGAPSQNGPAPLLGATAAFGAEVLFVYGGLENNMRRDSAYRYDLVEDAWETLPRGPRARSSAFGVFDGSAFYVWGGRDGMSVIPDGALFETSWKPMKAMNAPSARSAPPRQTGWSFALGPGDVVFLGGQDEHSDYLTDGGRYSTAAGWTRLPSWPSGEDHGYGAAALIGGQILIWGGSNNNTPSATGERWAP